eukprot:CAMPEP_0170556658 /NCGR_PEP_ID=MMETSP0211-20121228/18012_1 /TAXON_ID=311385 /ORGANISM="Pseudokeronopsis sp., Strain OXSARD2" /LENGTH=63 /DNA_ID=CAMNT_0010867135 /DNA_START=15 /DNA_END=206 /DNA_ORIENTATION=+
MAGGGGGMKKAAINLVLDKPAHVYVGGGVLIWAIRRYQIESTYNLHFGKFEFYRKYGTTIPVP